MTNQAKQDLWGDLDALGDDETHNPVLALLNDQAALLSDKTGGRIEAKVEPLASGASSLMVRFVLVVSRLGGYRYELFRVFQRSIDFPVDVIVGDESTTCDDEPAYRQTIEAVLKSTTTRHALANLLAAERSAVDI